MEKTTPLRENENSTDTKNPNLIHNKDVSPIIIHPTLPGTTDPPPIKVSPSKRDVLAPILRSFSSPTIDCLKPFPKLPSLTSKASIPSHSNEAPNEKPLDHQSPIHPSQTESRSSSLISNSNSIPTSSSPPTKPRMRASTGMLHTHRASVLPSETDAESQDVSALDQSSHESILHRLYRRVKTIVDLRPSYLNIFIGTWNMHGTIPTNLSFFLPDPSHPSSTATTTSTTTSSSSPISKKHGWKEFTSIFRFDEPQYHLLAFGTQECQKSIQESVLFPSKAEWEKKLKLFYQEHYDMISSETMAALHLCIFIRKKLKPMVERHSVPTGLGGVVGNKGAVAIALKIEKTSFLFVNLHLTAHQNNTLLRNGDYQKIETELKFNHFPTTQTLISDHFDYVFFFGDTNYRIDLPLNPSPHGLNPFTPSVELLFPRDQLTKERQARRAFIGFNEPKIGFLPTFKLKPMTSLEYNLKRIPAWTDRILFKSKPNAFIQCLHYSAIHEQLGSDHAPVIGVYEISLLDKEDEEGSPLFYRKKKKKKQKSPCLSCSCFACIRFWNCKKKK